MLLLGTQFGEKGVGFSKDDCDEILSMFKEIYIIEACSLAVFGTFWDYRYVVTPFNLKYMDVCLCVWFIKLVAPEK